MSHLTIVIDEEKQAFVSLKRDKVGFNVKWVLIRSFCVETASDFCNINDASRIKSDFYSLKSEASLSNNEIAENDRCWINRRKPTQELNFDS